MQLRIIGRTWPHEGWSDRRRPIFGSPGMPSRRLRRRVAGSRLAESPKADTPPHHGRGRPSPFLAALPRGMDADGTVLSATGEWHQGSVLPRRQSETRRGGLVGTVPAGCLPYRSERKRSRLQAAGATISALRATRVPPGRGCLNNSSKREEGLAPSAPLPTFVPVSGIPRYLGRPRRRVTVPRGIEGSKAVRILEASSVQSIASRHVVPEPDPPAPASRITHMMRGEQTRLPGPGRDG